MGTQSRTLVSSGFLFLRIPETRDVFYADDIKFYAPLCNQGTYPDNAKQPQFLGNGNLWMNGTKEEFFHIEADMECTIIEGLYIDHNEVRFQPYAITIYIELEI